jgi:hypothetical protein
MMRKVIILGLVPFAICGCAGSEQHNTLTRVARIERIKQI